MDRVATPAKAQEMLEKYADQVLPAMKQAGLAWAFIASRHAIRTKLSGQRLNRRTGTLQRAVAASAEAHEAGNGITGSFGTILDYGVAHEQGFNPPDGVPVRAHQRMGRPVRAHQRMVNIRARWYLRDSAAEKESMLQVVVDEASNVLLSAGKVATAKALLAKVV